MTKSRLFLLPIFLIVCLNAQAKAPANIGDLKRQITEYKRSGAYDRDLAEVIKKAQAYIERRAPSVRMPAIVLDIDETSLSNWQQIQANDYGTRVDGPCNLPAGPCGLISWQTSAKADVIAPTLALFNAIKAKGIAVFFITGRDERVRGATEMNLRTAGYDGWTELIMRPSGTTTRSAADFKAPERAKIAAKGFTIIANIGDQPSDLSGGYAERTFLLPDPFYRIP
jgi:predicted secreted acid phosphatase